MIDWVYEVVKILANGAVIACVILSVYVIQKRVEVRKDRRDYASVMLNEMKRILEISSDGDKDILSHWIDPIKIKISGVNSARIPTIDAYQGLMYSDNIKHFDNDLQSKMAVVYGQFRVESLKPNQKLCVSIVKELEQIIKRNRRARFFFYN